MRCAVRVTGLPAIGFCNGLIAKHDKTSQLVPPMDEGLCCAHKFPTSIHGSSLPISGLMHNKETDTIPGLIETFKICSRR